MRLLRIFENGNQVNFTDKMEQIFYKRSKIIFKNLYEIKDYDAFYRQMTYYKQAKQDINAAV